MPHELTRHLVDVPVTPIERAWAYDQYQGVKNLAKAYRSVEYDSDALSGKVPKRIEGRAYTLMNLQAYGGTCMDQTYFASQVGRILGYPVAAIRHDGPGITGHKWCLQFAPDYKQPAWREVGGTGFGWVRDPATDRRATDQGMAFAVHSLAFEPPRRELAAIFARIARRVPGWVRADVPAGPDVLAAVVYAKSRDGQLELSTRHSSRYYQAERPLKPSWLLEKALDLDPYQPAVWDAVETLGRAREISADELIMFMSRLQQVAGETYPDVYHLGVLNVYSGLPPERAVALLEAAGSGLTRDQQDRAPLLAGQLWLAIGDLYASNERPHAALASYERAVLVDPDYPPTVVRALERGLKVSRGAGIDDRILPVCQQIFDEFRQPLYGKAIGDELARAGLPAQAVTWYRHVFDRTRRDDPGRYEALRAAIDLLSARTRFRTAAVWAAELYAETGHPADGRRWADALAAGGRVRDAAVVMQRVAIAEAERQRDLNEDAARRARRSR
jgi:tetratricopeptide (TPR) repeat protein